MIRIKRPATLPAMLKNRSATETVANCVDYDKHSADFISGSRKFSADSTIYSADSVKNTLMKCQHNKCCYSEARFVREAKHVDHFHPAGAVTTIGSHTKTYPGYYWLAYEWTNLLLCKGNINSKKGDLFPLVDESRRARSHHDDVSLEQPMLIDPSSEDPRDHIRFNKHDPYGITDRGKYTVKLLLDHPELTDARLERLQLLEGYKAMLLLLGPAHTMHALYTKLLNDAVQPDAPFSSMAIDLVNE